MLLTTAATTFYFKGFLIDLIYITVIAVVLYVLLTYALRREDWGRLAAGLVVLLGVLIAVADNLT